MFSRFQSLSNPQPLHQGLWKFLPCYRGGCYLEVYQWLSRQQDYAVLDSLYHPQPERFCGEVGRRLSLLFFGLMEFYFSLCTLLLKTFYHLYCRMSKLATKIDKYYLLVYNLSQYNNFGQKNKTSAQNTGLITSFVPSKDYIIMKILPYFQCNTKFCDFTGHPVQPGLSAGDPGYAGGGQYANPLTGRQSPPFSSYDPRLLLRMTGPSAVAFGGPVSSFGVGGDNV